MRYAGTAIENFMGTGPKYGETASHAAMQQAKQDINRIGLAGKTKALGIGEAAKTKAQELVLDAKGHYNAAQQQASNMATIGGLLGQGIGGLGGMNSSGGKFAGNPASVGVSGFGDTPSTQVAFGHGGGTHNGFGTFGPNWGY